MNEEMLRKLIDLAEMYGRQGYDDMRGVKDRMEQLILLAMDAAEEQKKQTAILSDIAAKLGIEQEKLTSTNESAFK